MPDREHQTFPVTVYTRSMTLRQRLAATATLVLLTLASTSACGNKSTPTTAVDVARAYFTALASNDAGATKDAAKLARPDSIAAAYAAYIHEGVLASDDGNVDRPAGKVSRVNGGFTICYGSKNCVSYTTVAVVGLKVASFNVAGSPITQRLVTVGGAPAPIDSVATVAVQSRYVSPQSGSMTLTLEVTSLAQPITLKNGVLPYKAADGTLSSPAQAWGPTTLGAHQIGHVLVTYAAGVVPGGTLTFGVLDSAGKVHAVLIQVQ